MKKKGKDEEEKKGKLGKACLREKERNKMLATQSTTCPLCARTEAAERNTSIPKAELVTPIRPLLLKPAD